MNLRRVVETPCWLAHRLWWVPYWNRSYFLSCPFGWLMSRSERFQTWYMEEDVSAPVTGGGIEAAP